MLTMAQPSSPLAIPKQGRGKANAFGASLQEGLQRRQAGVRIRHHVGAIHQSNARCLSLISSEKEAEIAGSLDAVSTLKPLVAQKRGSTLLNLKCTEVQSGLLGKTLLELQPNRGETCTVCIFIVPLLGSCVRACKVVMMLGWIAISFTPHDDVNIELNKGDSSSPSLGQGRTRSGEFASTCRRGPT